MTIQRLAFVLTVALGFSAPSVAAHSTSEDVTWRWTGGGTTTCNGIGTGAPFTVVVNATIEVPRFEGPTNFVILKNVSATAHGPEFRNEKVFLSVSADLVAVPRGATRRGRSDYTKDQAKRTVVTFVKASEASAGAPRGLGESERLMLRVMRVATGSAIKLTAAERVATNSGTCLLGSSTYNTPLLADPPSLSPPAAPMGIRIVPVP
jgi:hypothetical protein